MSSAQLEREQMELSATNIGGIDDTDVTFQSGVSVLAGHNATNRTSLLQALMGALGSDAISLKGDADEGHIELTVGDATYTRTLTRRNEAVTSGNPYDGR
jgi:predicted ATP-dependent endonuclease of OLD family